MQPHPISQDLFQTPAPRPMVKVAIAFFCGVVYACYFPLNITLALAVMLFLLLAWVMIVRRSAFNPEHSFHWGLALLLSGIIGAVRMEAQNVNWQNRANEIQSLARMGEQTLRGTVEEIREYENGQASAFLTNVQLEKYNRERFFPAKVELRTTSERLSGLIPGDQVETHGWLSPVRGPAVPTSFDYQEYRYSANSWANVYIEKETPILRLESSSWSWPRGLAYQAIKTIRQTFGTFPALFQKTSSDTDRLGLISSICFGMRSNMPSDLSDALTRSGLAHLTSISGLHVSMVMMGFAYALKRAGMKRKLAAILTSAMMVFYVLFVGARIPTLRATLMTFVLLGQFWAQRRIDSMNSLAIAAILLLFLSPAELFLPSFQLSFTAVFILLLLMPVNRFIQKRIHSQPARWFLLGILTSTAVTTGLAPFTISYFHTWSWGAIPGNLVAIPLVGVLLPLSYAWIISAILPLPWLTAGLGFLTASLTDLLLQIIREFAHPAFYLTFSRVDSGKSVILFFAMILLFSFPVILIKIRPIPLRAGYLALTMIAGILWLSPWIERWRPFRMDFLSLGQGDCIVIRTNDNHVALVDGGHPSTNTGSQPPLLIEYLHSEGIRRIDMIVLTHPDSDHIGELAQAVRNFPVDYVLEGNRQDDSRIYREFEDTLSAYPVQKQQIFRGDRIQLGKNTVFWVLNPGVGEISKDNNEQSVVLLMQYQDLDVLLTGDISQKIEEKLCSLYDNWPVEILKVAHHGSKYSTSKPFLTEIQPEFGIIQVGRNSYGHPSEETRNRLYDIGTHVLRTDYDGTIRLTYGYSGLRLVTTRSNRLYIPKRKETQQSQ